MTEERVAAIAGQLVGQKAAARFVDVSVATLQRWGDCGGAKKILPPTPGRTRPIVRYDLAELRFWVDLHQSGDSAKQVLKRTG